MLSAYEMLCNLRPYCDDPQKLMSPDFYEEMNVFSLRFLREPFNNPRMQPSSNVAVWIPSQPTTDPTKPQMLFFDVICKSSREKYECCIDPQTDVIKIIKQKVMSHSECARTIVVP